MDIKEIEIKIEELKTNINDLLRYYREMKISKTIE